MKRAVELSVEGHDRQIDDALVAFKNRETVLPRAQLIVGGVIVWVMNRLDTEQIECIGQTGGSGLAQTNTKDLAMTLWAHFASGFHQLGCIADCERRWKAIRVAACLVCQANTRVFDGEIHEGKWRRGWITHASIADSRQKKAQRQRVTCRDPGDMRVAAGQRLPWRMRPVLACAPAPRAALDRNHRQAI